MEENPISEQERIAFQDKVKRLMCELFKKYGEQGNFFEKNPNELVVKEGSNGTKNEQILILAIPGSEEGKPEFLVEVLGTVNNDFSIPSSNIGLNILNLDSKSLETHRRTKEEPISKIFSSVWVENRYPLASQRKTAVDCYDGAFQGNDYRNLSFSTNAFSSKSLFDAFSAKLDTVSTAMESNKIKVLECSADTSGMYVKAPQMV